MNINKTLFYGGLMEAEGMDDIITTKTARINAAINDFVISAQHGWNINTWTEDILAHHGLSFDSLSQEEIKYIKREVERRVNEEF